jgi:hypothetical protein
MQWPDNGSKPLQDSQDRCIQRMVIRCGLILDVGFSRAGEVNLPEPL